MWRFIFALSWLTAESSAFAPVSTSVRRVTTTSSAAASTSSALAAETAGVVITGGAGGVGFAYAGEFLERGYNVVICDVQDCSSAAAALQGRRTNGAQIFHTKCDVSNPQDVEKLGQFAQTNLGTIGYWINNAGTFACIEVIHGNMVEGAPRMLLVDRPAFLLPSLSHASTHASLRGNLHRYQWRTPCSY